MLLTIPDIKTAYIDTGKVRYIFHDFPLAMHPNAQIAARAGRCAGAQGAFWAMHDKLFSAQSEWSGQSDPAKVFAGYAASLGLDGAALSACLASGQFDAAIAADVAAGKAAGISGTPSFRINGRLLVGAAGYETFRQRIEAELARVK